MPLSTTQSIRKKRILLYLTLLAILFRSIDTRASQIIDTPVTQLEANTKWVNAGYAFGWTELQDHGRLQFQTSVPAKGVPTFRYSRRFSGTDLSVMPKITIPFGLVLDDSAIDDNFLTGLSQQKKLRQLCIKFGPVTSAGMKEVGKASDLTHLEISNLGNKSNMDDATQSDDFDSGVEYIANLQNLVALNFSETRIGNKGLKHIGKMKKLKVLNLRATRITNDGLDIITSLTELRVLDLRDTAVTKEALAKIRTAMPKTTLLFGDIKE